MQKRINIYIPNLLSINDPIRSCQALPSLQALFMLTQPQKINDHVTQLYLDNLAIANILAKKYAPRLTNMSHLIAQPVHIDLDQSQGYIKLIDHKKITESIYHQATEKLQSWAKHDNVVITPLPNHYAWLFSTNEVHQNYLLQRPENFSGESIYPHLPQAKLLRWFNESQMLFHLVTEANNIGMNSLWFWGNGDNPVNDYDALITRDWYLHTYAEATHIASHQQWDDKILHQYEKILYVNYHGQQYQQQNRCDILDETLFQPILHAFKNKLISEIHLYFSEELSFTVSQSTKKKWWQKKSTMEAIFNDSSET